MYKTINFCDFCDEFRGSQYENNFSYNGKRALFDYLENIEEDTGEKIELDIVALCCDYTEYDSLQDCLDNYNNIEDREDLENNTTVIDVKNERIIIQNF